MGRLIDIDVLFDYFGNDAIDKTTRSNIEYFVSEKGTVDAIPKSDYENRLKADIVAMLTEIQLEIEESENCGKAFHLGLQMASNIIQQKINELKQEPTTKDDLGVDAVSRQAVLELIADYDLSMGQVVRGIHALPSVIPQEPRWIPCSEKKPNKGGEYLLWGKICDDDDEEYCFLGDYYEFEEKFGIEKGNYDPHTLGFLDTEIEEYYSVVAWMPLPKPYESQESEGT